jgi:hypothetical protein
MGLDIIEFVMNVEEKFSIEIPDADAQHLTTPRKLVDYLMTRVKAGADRGCLSQREFHRLRRAVIARNWATRDSLKTDTPLEGIVPKPNRRSVWEHLGEEVQAPRWPDLVRPTFIKAGLVLIAVVAFSLPWALQGGEIVRGHLTPVMLSIISTTVVVWVGIAATRPLRVAFPPQYACVGDVGRFLVAANHQPRKADVGWTREQVRETVRALIVENFAVTEFSDDSRFVQDMHIDE